MFGRMLRNVKIDFRSLSPRAFIFIRGIMTQLLNAHLAFRIVSFSKDGKIDEARSYKELKKALNSHSSFRMFLSRLRDWEPTSIVSAPAESLIDHDEVPNVPNRNRFTFFNTAEGRRVRLAAMMHDVVSACRPGRCYLCQGVTTARCSFCQIPLCRFPFGTNRHSCWFRHHNNQRVSVLL